MSPPAQRTGLARTMMDAVMRAARTGNADTIWLSVWEHNPRAIAFYRKAGFEIVGGKAFVVGTDVQTDHVMAARLSAPDLAGQ